MRLTSRFAALVVLLAVAMLALAAHRTRMEPFAPPVFSPLALNDRRYPVNCFVTVYESYPTTAAECTEFNGCKWAGLFAGINGKRSKEWVKRRNIAAVHQDDYGQWKNKWVRLYWGGRYLDVKVVDMCSPDDSKWCDINRGKNFLIDLEIHTARRLVGPRIGTTWSGAARFRESPAVTHGVPWILGPGIQPTIVQGTNFENSRP